MKQNAWIAVVGAGVVAILIGLFFNRQTTEWSSDVPHRFRGTWKLIEDYYSDNYGIRSMQLSANVIVLEMVFGEGENEELRFPIRKVSITARRESKAGEMVIFYGEADDDVIAKNRLQVYFGSKQKISVQEIVQTGWVEEPAAWFDVGEFVKVK